MGRTGASLHLNGPRNRDHIMWMAVTEEVPQVSDIALIDLFDRKERDLQLKVLYSRAGEGGEKK